MMWRADARLLRQVDTHVSREPRGVALPEIERDSASTSVKCPVAGSGHTGLHRCQHPGP
jgi:hypothetical protein